MRRERGPSHRGERTEKSTHMTKYAITGDDGHASFEAGEFMFVSSLEEAMDMAYHDGAESAEGLVVVEAQRFALSAPNITDAVDDELQNLSIDHREAIAQEVSFAVAAAQKALDDAFEKINQRGPWRSTDRIIDAEKVKRAFLDAQMRGYRPQKLQDSSGDKPIVASAAARTHELKTVQPHYDNVVSGKKTVDVRRDDRGFAEGDILVLREYDAATASCSGRRHVVEVTHVLDGFEGLTPGWVAMSIRTRRRARVDTRATERHEQARGATTMSGQGSTKRHACDEAGDCVHSGKACEKNVTAGLNPDGTEPVCHCGEAANGPSHTTPSYTPDFVESVLEAMFPATRTRRMRAR